MCLCCPYGCYFTIPTICVVFAIAFTSGASWTCDFMRVTYRNEGIFTSPQGSRFSVGPWTVEDFAVANGRIVSTDRYVGWDHHETLTGNDRDSALNFARAMLFIVCVTAYLVTSCFCLGSCLVLGRTFLKGISCFFFLFAVLFPLSLVRIHHSFKSILGWSCGTGNSSRGILHGSLMCVCVSFFVCW